MCGVSRQHFNLLSFSFAKSVVFSRFCEKQQGNNAKALYGILPTLQS